MQPIHYHGNDDFAINEKLHDLSKAAVNISPN